MTGARHPFVRPVASATLLLGFLLAGPAPAEGQGVTLRAAAGLGGAARAGRWMPVAVTIGTGAAIDGTVEATLEGRRARRDVSLAAQTNQRIELYLRAPDSDAATVHVRFSAGNATADAAVRIVPSDSAFTLCVSASGVTPATECTTIVDTGGVPESWRGFDAADHIAWAPAAHAGLRQEQRHAAGRARSLRAWNNSTNMAPRMPLLPGATGAPRNPALPLFVLLLAAAVAVTPSLSRRPEVLYAATAVLILAGSAAAFAHGRLGAAARLQVREAIVMRTGDAEDGAQLFARGIATFPAADSFAATAALADGEITAEGIRDATVSTDAAGGATVRGIAPKRAALEYDVTGFESHGPVNIADDGGGRLRITNLRNTPLRGCSASSGVTLSSPADVAPGGSIDLVRDPGAADPVLTCEFEMPTSSLAWNRNQVDVRTQAVLVIDLRQPEDDR